VNVKRISLAQAREMFPGPVRGGPMPVPVFDEMSLQVGSDPRDAVLERCHVDPRYQRWVLACLQVRISIQADQTFPHPPDRRAQVAKIIRASLSTG